MFGRKPETSSILDIERGFPNQWVAVAVKETDPDGFAAAGEVIVHDADEVLVWSAVRLGDTDDPVYIFHTGRRRPHLVAA